MGLQGVTEGYMRVQGVTRGYRGLHEVRRGYSGLHGAGAHQMEPPSPLIS